jgi:hypothetical protein
MAEFFEQHGLDLCCGGGLQPVGVEIDAFGAGWIAAGVRAVDAAEGGAIEDFEADAQAGAGEQGLEIGGGLRVLNPEDVEQQPKTSSSRAL